MKKPLLLLSLLALAGAAPAFAADVGVSISVGQPGFYGQINIGDFPQPEVIYAQPRIIQPVPIGVPVEPLYLRVPPGHYKHWDRYCGRYNACGRPVYFVRDNWYNNVYAPRYRERYGHEEHEEHRREDWHDHDRGEHGDRGDHDHGHGHGGEHGHGHGHDD